MRYVNCLGVSVAVVFCAAAVFGQTAPAPKREAPAVKPAAPASSPRGPAKPGDLAPAVSAALEKAQSTGDFAAASVALTEHMDTVVASAPEKDARAFRDAAHGLRLVRLCVSAPEAARRDLLAYLRTNRPLAGAVVFVLDPATDTMPAAAALLDRLRRERGEAAARLPGLTAAMVAVHDTPLTAQINENTATAPDPVALFDYFAKAEGRLVFSPATTPPELLAFVVNATSAVDDLEWAAGRYPSNRDVGQRFFDITYDYEHFNSGSKKKVTQAGFTLPNIMKYGGVCADQAYFACGVGKALGVPTVYVVANSAEVGHAWVGYLQSRNRGAVWDFSEGRYDAYRWIRGNIVDPRSRKKVSDAEVGLLAALNVVSAEDREASEAMVDAAKRLLASPPKAGAGGAAGSGARRPAGKQRTGAPAEALALLEAAVNLSPGNVNAWRAMAEMASEGKMKNEEKSRWSAALRRLCGEEHADFAQEIMRPLIASMPSLADQADVWAGMSRDLAKRPDLAADALLELGKVREKQGDNAAALAVYDQILQRYAHVGMFVVDAVEASARLLEKSGRQGEVPALLEECWRRIQKPDTSGFFWGGSAWFRVGLMYADALRKAGRAADAEQTLRTIGIIPRSAR